MQPSDMTKSLADRRRTPSALFDAASVRELDRIAIDELNIPGTILMRRAALACVEVALQRWPDIEAIRVFCGSGNNAGDGYLIAGLFAERGVRAEAIVVGDIEKLSADARLAYQYCERSNAMIKPLSPDAFGVDTSLLVDAMLGIGLIGTVRADFAGVIEGINELSSTEGIPVLAVDIPSGLNADTGQILGVAVRAEATVTFIGTKQGLLTEDGPDATGELYFDDLEVPANLMLRVPANASLLTTQGLNGLLPKRPRNSHKNKFGHVLIVGGDEGMGGAVTMAAEAALRSGAGLVSVLTHPTHAGNLLVRMPELMVRGVSFDRNPKGSLGDSVGDTNVEKLLHQSSVVVLGPGLGQSDWSKQLFDVVINKTRQFDKQMVVDADGLNLLAAGIERRNNWVLTPHPGEASRLAAALRANRHNKPATERETEFELAISDRFVMSELLQQHFGGAIILKGVGSLVHDGGQICLCPYGNPGMSTAGMGDVLSGVVGALLGQGLNPGDAARLAVTMHALAGDRAVSVPGQRGLIATDLIAHLRRLCNEFT